MLGGRCVAGHGPHQVYEFLSVEVIGPRLDVTAMEGLGLSTGDLKEEEEEEEEGEDGNVLFSWQSGVCVCVLSFGILLLFPSLLSNLLWPLPSIPPPTRQHTIARSCVQNEYHQPNLSIYLSILSICISWDML